MSTPCSRSTPPIFLVLALLAGAVGGCGSDPAGAPHAAPAPVGRPAAPAPESAAAELPPERAAAPPVDVEGTLRGPDAGGAAALGARRVVIVDARGARREVRSDPRGAFRVEGVVPPYDLAVSPAGALGEGFAEAAPAAPTVLLGVRRADPSVEVLDGAAGASSRPAAQRVRAGVVFAPCPAGGCQVHVVSASASGGGGVVVPVAAGETTCALEVEHTWRAANLRSGERLRVDVLVTDEAREQFVHGALAGIAAAPGETVDAGMIPLAAVGTASIEVGAAGAPEVQDWDWTMAAWLDLPGGGSVALDYVGGPALVTRAPRIEGALLRFDAWAQHPRVEDRPYFHRSVHATSGPVPISSGEIAIDLPQPSAPSRPQPDGVLSRRAAEIAWRGQGLASVVLVDVGRRRERFRLVTDEASVSFARLERLGVARPQPGEHVLDVTTRPGEDVDSRAAPPSPPGSSAAAASYQRYRFRVTP